MGQSLKVKIFADGANESEMIALAAQPDIQGLTTNPTLMNKAGISDYEGFAKSVLPQINGKSISFEVFSDEFQEMERQALKIAGWGDNVYVKIPVTNSRMEPSYDLINKLSRAGVKVNVTALMTLDQVRRTTAAIESDRDAYISIFAGRIADTGRDPVPVMRDAVSMISAKPKIELIWASPREALNVMQADAVGCHIITATPDILKKISMFGYDLEQFSLDTVKMFRNDAVAAGFSL